MNNHTDETYLGDGLYVSTDGWHIVLRAPRDDGDHVVFLEPHVFNALLAYARKLAEQPSPDDAA